MGAGGCSRGYEGENKFFSPPARESSPDVQPSARPTYQVYMCVYIYGESESESESERKRELALGTPDVSGIATLLLKRCSV